MKNLDEKSFIDKISKAQAKDYEEIFPCDQIKKNCNYYYGLLPLIILLSAVCIVALLVCFLN